MPTDIDYAEDYRKTLKAAAALADAKGRTHFTAEDLFDGLCVVAPKAFSKTLGSTVRLPAHTLPPPGTIEDEIPSVTRYAGGVDAILSPVGGAMEVVINALDPDGHGGVTLRARHIAAAFVAHALLHKDCAYGIRALLGVNGICLDPALGEHLVARLGVEAIGMAKQRFRRSWTTLAERCAAIRAFMEAHVIGGRKVLASLVSALTCGWADAPSGEARSRPITLLIAGPVDSGRRHLARTLCAALRRSGVAKQEAFVDFAALFRPEDHLELFGRDASWKDGGAEGTLTGPVVREPQTVFVVNNLELGAATAQADLHRVISEGCQMDRLLGRKAHFGRAIVILLVGGAVESEALYRLLGENPPNDRLAAALGKEFPAIRRVAEASTAVLLTERDTVAEALEGARRGLLEGIGALASLFGLKPRLAEGATEAFCRAVVDSLPTLSVGAAVAMGQEVVGPLRQALVEAGPSKRGKLGFAIEPPTFPPLPREAKGASFEVHTSRRLAGARRLSFTPHVRREGDTFTLALTDLAYVVMPAIEDCGFFSVRPAEVSFDDLVGVGHVRERIEAALAWLTHPEAHAHGRRENGILLYGPPGTGKTMIAKAIANACGMAFIYVTGSDFASAYAGEGTKAVRKLFAAAQRTKAVVFIDEIDGLGNRDASGNGEDARIVNAFLTELDGFAQRDFLVIGATNLPERVDPALRRPGRLGLHLRLGELTREEDCLALVKMALADEGQENLPTHTLRRMANLSKGMTPAKIREFVGEAVRLAGGRPTETEHAALLAHNLARGYVTTTAPDRPVAWHTAYHEAGHAVAGLSLGLPVGQACVLPGPDTHGFVLFDVAEAEAHQDGGLFRKHLLVALAGHLAEELFGGNRDGSDDDFERAKELARKVVRLRPLDAGIILGDGSVTEDVRDTLSKAIAECRELLTKEAASVKTVAEALRSSGLLSGAELEALWRAAHPATERRDTATPHAREDTHNDR